MFIRPLQSNFVFPFLSYVWLHACDGDYYTRNSKKGGTFGTTLHGRTKLGKVQLNILWPNSTKQINSNIYAVSVPLPHITYLSLLWVVTFTIAIKPCFDWMNYTSLSFWYPANETSRLRNKTQVFIPSIKMSQNHLMSTPALQIP
jgi:hypothetical protein